jgi:hypothetical protein
MLSLPGAQLKEAEEQLYILPPFEHRYMGG